MQTIIKEFNESFGRLKVRQSDGTYVETTTVGEKGVLYWVRTRSGQILTGWDLEGLNLILNILAELEKDEHEALHSALTDIIGEGFDQLEVEVNLTKDGPTFALIYRDRDDGGLVKVTFENVDDLLRRNVGYLQPKK